MKNTIVFIGGGNMARSLMGGLIADGCAPKQLWVTDPNQDKLAGLQRDFSVHTTTANLDAAQHADVLVLAVKPQALKAVAHELAPLLQRRKPLVISIAAGIRTGALVAWLGGDLALVRAMPNTPALVRSGASALYANALVSEAQRSQAENILRAVGLALWLTDEAQMDAVTALSGSGPAYFFLVMEALEEAAMRLGLPRETAHLLTLETAFGAAKMALESSEGCGALRARVTSPGGTTEQALRVLQEGRIEALFETALRAAHARSAELATLLGGAA
ncbi:MAG: pyrroline-5-carboxylate reductase [Gammaproteobacteria bacterium]|nr:pyrroline-5-carboxylate reductase [Gammaproteobacteria bacterium]